jgi:hypothetical protein
MSFGSRENLHARHAIAKERANSESPARNVFSAAPMGPDAHIIASADIYSWKLKKEYDGSVFAVYCIHVALKCGFKWIVERRYSQFRELRREIYRIRPELSRLSFPKKNWMFNLSKSSLKHRQTVLNSYLSELIAITPQLLEISIFLEVEVRLASERSDKQTLRRTLSFGSLDQSLSIKDFQLIKVLGKGRWVTAMLLTHGFLFRPFLFDFVVNVWQLR